MGRLGGYRILRIVGQGGMGMVFLAHDPILDRKIALKVLLPALATSANRERFFREARSTASLNNDHVVPIFQIGEDNGVPFLAMPFLEGEALDRRLEKERKPPLKETLRIVREIATGLAAAHAKGLIHRDIKPPNIWLEVPRGRVRILDFGLARTAIDARVTQAGAILGTPSYMAPEQASGGEIDFRADLFSLGVVFYEMLTGFRPFKGPDTLAILKALIKSSPKEPSIIDSQIPKPLSELVMALISKDPLSRPDSAREVIQNLIPWEKEMVQASRTLIPDQTSNPPSQLPISADQIASPKTEELHSESLFLEKKPKKNLDGMGPSPSLKPILPPPPPFVEKKQDKPVLEAPPKQVDATNPNQAISTTKNATEIPPDPNGSGVPQKPSRQLVFSILGGALLLFAIFTPSKGCNQGRPPVNRNLEVNDNDLTLNPVDPPVIPFEDEPKENQEKPISEDPNHDKKNQKGPIVPNKTVQKGKTQEKTTKDLQQGQGKGPLANPKNQAGQTGGLNGKKIGVPKVPEKRFPGSDSQDKGPQSNQPPQPEKEDPKRIH